MSPNSNCRPMRIEDVRPHPASSPAGEENPAHTAAIPQTDTDLSRAVAVLARELLQSVDEGSAPELLELLSRIVSTDAESLKGTTRDKERLELLQSIAMRLRLDLHSMLAQIYQRLEAARAYVGVVRHLAEEPDAATCLGMTSPPATTENHPPRKSAVLLAWPRGG